MPQGTLKMPFGLQSVLANNDVCVFRSGAKACHATPSEAHHPLLWNM